MIWPVVLVGLPVLAVTFMVTGSMLDRENLGYWLTLYSRLMLFTVLLFMLFNFVFSLYSAAMVFRYRSFFQGVLALLAAVFSMGLASYFLVAFWRSQGVRIFSLRDKSWGDLFSLIFFVLMGIVVALSFFVTGAELGV